VYLAFWGWPQTEPGASALVFLLGLAFLVGHMLASVAAWLQPVVWGHAPGGSSDPLWGVFGHGGTYTDVEADRVARELERHYGAGLSRRRLYGLAYTDLQQAGKEARLVSLNSQIAFCRNAAVAFLVAAVAQGVGTVAGRGVLDGGWLVAAYLLGACMFAARYKRFWRQFGDNVIRGFRVLAKTQTRPSPPQETKGDESFDTESRTTD
jgi:hypothetical protein